MTKVAVIIPSLYEVDGAYLKLCVESLRATTDWDIIVVTNGTREQPDLAHIQGITRHLHTRDQGQCNAVNIGAQTVAPDTDYLFVSNSDMYYCPGWDAFLSFDDLCFSPNLIEPTDNGGSAPPFLKLPAGLRIEDFDPALVETFVRTHEPEEDTAGFNLPFFLRKDVWDTIGGYDTAYDPWGSNSDTDLQTKLNLAGITPIRVRNVLVYHFSQKSGTFMGDHQDAWWRNWRYYEQKWGFNRDQLQSDVWMNERMLPKDRGVIVYQPAWAGKYAEL